MRLTPIIVPITPIPTGNITFKLEDKASVIGANISADIIIRTPLNKFFYSFINKSYYKSKQETKTQNVQISICILITKFNLCNIFI